MPALVVFVVVAAYLAAATLAWRHIRHDGPSWPRHAAAALALALHLALLAHDMVEARSVVIGVGGALSLFAWQAALLLFIYGLRQPLAALALVVYPVAAVCLVLGAALPAGISARSALAWPLQTHILLSLLAFGLLTLGAVQALVLAVQHRRLHDRPPGDSLSIRLPPLQTMEALLFRLIGAGFFMLTLAIMSGGAFIENPFAQHLVHKTVLSLVAWLLFAILLWGRWRFGWRGRTAVRWTLTSYLVLALAYFGSKLVLETILGRHW